MQGGGKETEKEEPLALPGHMVPPYSHHAHTILLTPTIPAPTTLTWGKGIHPNPMVSELKRLSAYMTQESPVNFVTIHFHLAGGHLKMLPQFQRTEALRLHHKVRVNPPFLIRHETTRLVLGFYWVFWKS